MTDHRDIPDAIRAHLESRRADPDFRQRLRDRIEADREILARLDRDDPRPASMLQPVTFGTDDDEARRVPMHPVSEDEDIW